MTPASKQLHRTLNANTACHLGQSFRIARESLNLSQQEVADKLLLSKAQIEGLEVGKQNCFYGAQFYAQCADKYAAFLGLAEQPSEKLLDNPNDAEELELIREPLAKPKHLRWPLLAMSAGTIGLIAVGVSVWTQSITAPDTPPPLVAAEPITSAPITEPEQKPEQKQESTASTLPPSESDKSNLASNSIQLSFSDSSWVQVVETNGNRQEKTYKTGDTVTLEPSKLQGIIIGNAKAVTVSSPDGNININRYIAPGSQVARIIGPDARNLAKKTQF